MINAEEVIFGNNGAVVRLAGLYTADRGPHSFWLRSPKVDGSADGIINLVHYEDAASAVLGAALYNAGKISPTNLSPGDTDFQRVFLASDNHPISRRDICLAAIDSGKFPNGKVPEVSLSLTC